MAAKIRKRAGRAATAGSTSVAESREHESLRCKGLLIKVRQQDAARVQLDIGARFRQAQFQLVLPDPLWLLVKSSSIPENPRRAFELAHSLTRIRGIVSLELDLDRDTTAHETSVEAPRALRTQATPEDCRWHVEAVNAIAARAKFKVDGAGIRIGHLDTGYTNNPELVLGASVRADLGYNFYEDVVSPEEPLRTIDHGHGTATASVLIGAPGKQHTIPNVDAFAEGVAPGAELVPFRVDKNVWWIFGSKDALGIRRAVEIGCHVISMSRSGPSYEALHDAVLYAIDKGVIVIAAAGNCNAGCDIYAPAQYPEVVCAGGSTRAMTPWSSSSRGAAVTLCAPAHEVVRAFTINDNGDYAYGVAQSSGTSYATPIIAGAAALWLQRHGGHSAVVDKLGAPRLVAPRFKALLVSKGWQPGHDWDASKFGPGILDVMKLLDAPLTKTVRVKRPPLKITDDVMEVLARAGIPRSGPRASLFRQELEVYRYLMPVAAGIIIRAQTERREASTGDLDSLPLSRDLRVALSAH